MKWMMVCILERSILQNRNKVRKQVMFLLQVNRGTFNELVERMECTKIDEKSVKTLD